MTNMVCIRLTILATSLLATSCRRQNVVHLVQTLARLDQSTNTSVAEGHSVAGRMHSHRNDTLLPGVSPASPDRSPSKLHVEKTSEVVPAHDLGNATAARSTALADVSVLRNTTVRLATWQAPSKTEIFGGMCLGVLLGWCCCCCFVLPSMPQMNESGE